LRRCAAKKVMKWMGSGLRGVTWGRIEASR
jgi:hypothetical protein